MEITQDTEMQIKYGGYQGFKAKFDFVMNKTASYFVEIGQMLKEARDTDILRGSGYSGMGDFAAKEYGLRPDQRKNSATAGVISCRNMPPTVTQNYQKC